MEFCNLVAAGESAFALQIDSDIVHPLRPSKTPPVFGPHPNCQCSTTLHKAVCTPRNYTAGLTDHSPAVTVEDPYCPVTILLAVAIQCFALFTCFLILHKIWKFCKKFGQLILWKIFKFVAIRCQILRLKCTKFNSGWVSASDPTGEAYSAPQAS